MSGSSKLGIQETVEELKELLASQKCIFFEKCNYYIY
jgi:hypothetical protein